MSRAPAFKFVLTAVLACLSFVGALALYVAIGNRGLPQAQAPPTQLVFREGRDHPVTPEMQSAAKELGGQRAAPFSTVDADGTPLSLADLTRGKPLVLYFVELQCPCCKGAKPYIDRIKSYYGDVCNVVGIIDAKPDMARIWERTVVPQFQVIPDPEMKIIRAYRAERGVYTTLVAPGGRIVKAYPGYSQDMLRELTSNIARLAGIAPRHMPVAPAPKRMTSGCIFPGTKVPDDQL